MGQYMIERPIANHLCLRDGSEQCPNITVTLDQESATSRLVQEGYRDAWTNI